jgi:hypothetical protein
VRDCQVRIVTNVAEGATSLPMTGTRRAPRFTVIDGVEVRIDGRRAALVNLSVIGAQVISTTALRPNQRGKFAFVGNAEKTAPLPCSIAWASLEIVGGAPRYRAGVESSDPDATAVQQFIDAKRA